MGDLASTYRHQGKWNEADQLQVQVMYMSKKPLDPELPDSLKFNSMKNLASIYRDQRKWNEAEQLQVPHSGVTVYHII